MVIFIVVVLFLVFSAIGYLLLVQAGLVPGPGGAYRDSRGVRVPRLPELPQGCLVLLLVAGVVWFVLWSFVLVLALRFLQSPLG
jgi:hypothetical protein